MAEVYGEKLYLSSAQKTIYLNLGEINNSEQISSYVNSWVRKKILEEEIRTSVETDSEIKLLTKKYESSLLLDKFERKLVVGNLDTIIFDSEIKNYYNDNKDHFRLTTPIFRFYFTKIEANKPKIDAFFTWWKRGDKEKVKEYCLNYSSQYLLDDDKWYELTFLKLLMPENLFGESNFTNDKMLQKNKKGNEYFLKIIEKIEKNDFPPLEFVKEDIKRIVLQKRKLSLIRKWKKELFKKEFLNENVKIYL